MINEFILGAYTFTTINLLILAGILLIRRKNNLPNVILAMFILMHAIVFIFNLLLFTKKLNPSYYFLCSLPASLVGPFAYLYCQSILRGKKETLKLKNLLHFLPSILYLLFLSFSESLILGNYVSSDLLNNTGDFPGFINPIIYFHVPLYYLFTWILYVRHSKKEHSSFEKDFLKLKYSRDFILTISFLLLAFYIIKIISYLLSYTTFAGIAIAPIVLFLMFIFVLKVALKNNPVFSFNSTEEPDKTIKVSSLELSNELILFLDKEIKEAFEDQKVYLDKELSLNKLSGLINVNSRTISQYVNFKYQKNFNDFINEFRVKESKVLLLNPEFENLKLEAIGAKAGFNSRAAFFSNFKKITGQTPATYKKMKESDVL